MIITNSNIYNITYENTKINYEKLTKLINDFLISKNLKYLILVQFMSTRDQEALQG